MVVSRARSSDTMASSTGFSSGLAVAMMNHVAPSCSSLFTVLGAVAEGPGRGPPNKPKDGSNGTGTRKQTVEEDVGDRQYIFIRDMDSGAPRGIWYRRCGHNKNGNTKRTFATAIPMTAVLLKQRDLGDRPHICISDVDSWAPRGIWYRRCGHKQKWKHKKDLCYSDTKDGCPTQSKRPGR